MKYHFIAIGGATEDLTFHTKEGSVISNRSDVLRQKLLAFEYGAKVGIKNSRRTFGGGAANVAVALSKLGFKVASVIAIGDDERGKNILNNLKKNKVDVGFVQKIKNEESGFSFVVVGAGNEHIVFTDRGANHALKIQNYQLKFLKDTFYFYISSLSGNWHHVLDNLFSVEGVGKIWNPGQTQIEAGADKLRGYLKKTGILILNKDEAIELVSSDKRYKKHNNKFLNNVSNLLKILKSFGPQAVVITSGSGGAYFFDGDNLVHQKAIKQKNIVDTTGVGDAFGASFVAGLEIYDGNINKAMKLAAKNSSSVLLKQGAQNGLLTRKDLV